MAKSNSKNKSGSKSKKAPVKSKVILEISSQESGLTVEETLQKIAKLDSYLKKIDRRIDRHITAYERAASVTKDKKEVIDKGLSAYNLKKKGQYQA